LLYQLEKIAGNAEAIKNGGRKEMSNSTRKYPLFINEFFKKHVNSFMKRVMKNALQIEHYWGRAEFAPGRGAIHLHVVAVAKDRAFLQDFYKATTLEGKAKVLNKYAIKHLDMTADAKVSDNLDYCPNYLSSLLARRFCACCDEEKDATQLAQDCMMHQYCLKSTKVGTPRMCRSHYGTESEFEKVDTPGMDLMQSAEIQIDRKGISHFRMRRTHSVHWFSISNTSSKHGEQIVMSSCFCISVIQPAQTCVKLKMSVDMLWPIPARDTIHLKIRKKRFRISSWGKYILLEIFWNWKKLPDCMLTKIVLLYLEHKMIT
jgi:hypothetical protein